MFEPDALDRMMEAVGGWPEVTQESGHTRTTYPCGYHILEDAAGRREYFFKGLRHWVGGPAVTNPDGSEEWWFEGKLHRVGGPAVRCRWLTFFELHPVEPGSTPLWVYEWYEHGRRHRLDGPAYISPTEDRWYRQGSLHRLDGPAVVCKVTGKKEWFVGDLRHRADGPAVERPTKRTEYWWRGRRLAKRDWKRLVAS